MWQVLFRIPIPNPWGPDIPIYGYGAMLVVALFICTWLAGRRAEKAGISKEHIQDLAFWIVIAGICGARLVFMIQYGQPLSEFFFLWKGGLVFYGALLGGVVGFLLGYRFVIKKHNLSAWKIADVLAPSIALGLAIGRIGCLLNGCCYGNVACPACLAVSYPLNSFPAEKLVPTGVQAPLGLTIYPPEQLATSVTVNQIDPTSAAARAGLRPDDVIVKVAGLPDDGNPRPVDRALDPTEWPPGKSYPLQLTVQRPAGVKNLPDAASAVSPLGVFFRKPQFEEVALPPFGPRTIGLHPTQVYETVSMGLLFLVLNFYYPLRRRDGEVFVLFLLAYPVHRFFNEMLRNDTDPVALGMTLSQNGSLLIFLVAAGLAVWVFRRPVQYTGEAPAEAPAQGQAGATPMTPNGVKPTAVKKAQAEVRKKG
jgi:phosphatidylglycerol:prolipoprotein diacylglycerol transferase